MVSLSVSVVKGVSSHLLHKPSIVFSHFSAITYSDHNRKETISNMNEKELKLCQKTKKYGSAVNSCYLVFTFYSVNDDITTCNINEKI